MELRSQLKDRKRIIVKVGTSTLTYPNGKLNLSRIERLAWVLTDIKNSGKDVVLVTSGAIGVGSVNLNFEKRPDEIRKKQAAAAVGQAILMQIYLNFFKTYNQKVAQILLTKEDTGSEKRRRNTINTLETLLEMGVIPIVNANDTISVFEIEFSDNDRLSALVAELIDADLLILLTDIDAMYDSDPKVNKNAKRLSVVPAVTEAVEKMAGTAGSTFSVGGMATKVAAAKMCEENGIDMVIAMGEDPAIIQRILNGEDVGTLFSLYRKG